MRMGLVFFCTMLGLPLASSCPATADDKPPLQLHLRSRIRGDGDQFTVVEKKADWDPKKTAIIICDMWDDHWCKSAARRVAEMAGPLNEVVKARRTRGVFIIHAPSSVTGFYKDTPQRKLAQDARSPRRPCRSRPTDAGARPGAGPTRNANRPCRSTTRTWAATAP